MEFILKYKKYFIIGVILSLFLVGLIFTYCFNIDSNQKENVVINKKTLVKEKNKKEEQQEPEEIIVTEYYVDIKGAVNNPGVYKLTSNSIVNDVVTIAGGITEDGDTTCINLSKQITNEMVIYIYTKEETKELRKKEEVKEENKNLVCNNIVNETYIEPFNNNSTSNIESNKTNTENTTSENKKEEITEQMTTEKTNINTATIDVLSILPNIGESKAKAIIEYRESKGDFTTIEEIKEVSGIGESTFLKIKDLITV